MTLDLAKQFQVPGVTASVFGDDNDPALFYVMPDQPRFRIDDQTKKPVFKFIKYKLPVDRPDGKKGGGFVVFDSQFVVPDDQMAKIKQWADGQVSGMGQGGQAVTARIEHIPYTSASASLTLLDTSGVLVSKIDSPGKPSVFGTMICPFTAELTPEGATVIEAAMQGSGGVAQISYDLKFPATFPPITGYIWFNASKFYSFYQTIDKSGGSWDSSNDTENKNTQQDFINSNSGMVWFDFESLGFITDDTMRQKVHDAISNWGWGQIDAATKAITLPDIAASTDTGDDGMDHVTKSETTFESASFYRNISEREGVPFETNQGGTLPNITDMGFKWADFAIEVDTNDPFFATIEASVAVNADFDKYGINSVDAHLEYTKITPATVQDFHFTKPDDIGKFSSDTNNGDMNYGYSFLVNYKDQSKSYQSAPFTTNHTAITINANDLGILYADLTIGNVDFAKTPQVQVAITYPDTDAAGQPISQQFNFDTTKKSDTLLAVLLKPVDKSYTYVVTYIMADGTQIVMDPVTSQSSQIFINSPFVLHTFSFLAEGDFVNSIDNIFLKMAYDDPVNKVSESTDFTFTASVRQKDWTIPVVANAQGAISYSGVTSYKNHTTEDIPSTPATSDLIEFGPPNQVIISVTPDTTLIDFTQVRMVKVDLEYQDDGHQIDVKQEFLLKPGGATPAPWTFYARDPKKTSYSWTATYYMAGTPPKVVTDGPHTSSDTDLVLIVPS
jgi:hypothetical protein